MHKWNGCTCERCGKIRDEQHQWNGCVCTLCGEKRKKGHEWDGCTCKICGGRRRSGHRWDNCVCQVCGKIEHKFALVACKICGAPRPNKKIGEDIGEALFDLVGSAQMVKAVFPNASGVVIEDERDYQNRGLQKLWAFRIGVRDAVPPDAVSSIAQTAAKQCVFRAKSSVFLSTMEGFASSETASGAAPTGLVERELSSVLEVALGGDEHGDPGNPSVAWKRKVLDAVKSLRSQFTHLRFKARFA